MSMMVHIVIFVLMHSGPCSGWIAIALIKEQVAAGIHSHLCLCSGPCSGPCHWWIAITFTQERGKRQ